MQGNIVVVTGVSAGVGRATAVEFGRNGWRAALIARGTDGLEGARKEVEQAGGRAMILPADVADEVQVEAAAERVEREWGPIDVWVNNAMATIFCDFTRIPPEDFRRATEVTYLGTVWGTLAALKRMKPRDRGVIVQIGSALAYRSIPLQAPYCGAKAAIRGCLAVGRAARCLAKNVMRVQMNRREFLYRAGAFAVSIPAAAGCTATRPPAGVTERDRARRALESNFFTTLERLYLAADSTRALIAASEGVLIFPTVVSIGPPPRTEIGRGALRVANVFTSYFHLVSSQEYRWEGSGAAAFIFAFTSFEALNEFRGSPAWPAARAEPVSAARLAAMAGQERARYPAVSALVLDEGRLVSAPTLAGLTVVPTEL